jgi:hypothetical protein
MTNQVGTNGASLLIYKPFVDTCAKEPGHRSPDEPYQGEAEQHCVCFGLLSSLFSV